MSSDSKFRSDSKYGSESKLCSDSEYGSNSKSCSDSGYGSDSKFGINMKRYCREHEKFVLSQEASPGLCEMHMEKIRILQHERLVHLIVTVMVVIIELFVTDLVLLHPETAPYSALVMLGLAILLGFYFFHYFFLENTVQRWYAIADHLREEVSKKVNIS